MSFEINENVKYVGKIDWELKKFHGDELSTHKGSSYNSYLVRDEKIALIDCVWGPFAKEFVANLKKELDLNTVDYIIANHGEPDHSGALPELMKEIPNTPIYCTANAIKSLKGQYHQDWNFIPVKTGDKLSLGSKEFIFIEARMLHWPDTMFTYLTGDNILFSNDGFGQHLASELMFNDLVNQADLYHEAQKYYANILNPFSKMVENKIKEILSLNLPVDMICPSHGVIWRDNPLQIVNKYMEWATSYQEDQITIIYDTMWNSTRQMAEKIAAGIRLSDPEVVVKLFNSNSTHADKNDIITEVFKSKAILVGSPTINKGVSFAVAGILEMIKGLAFKNKKAAAFGSYGWSGEGNKLISAELEHSGFELLNEGLKVTWNPDEDSHTKCLEFGQSIGQALK
ncbi:MAG TPA: anaerobic nitric oxide reductase flavorubredoxin [Desulfosporosinus sp.]|nr:anaerobic nitric oxide reductase flavorubredoxin [Desulfosporosinus sp.]